MNALRSCHSARPISGLPLSPSGHRSRVLAKQR